MQEIQKNNTICNKCKVPKDTEEEYYKDRKTVCKECLKLDMIKNRNSKKEIYLEKERIRRQNQDKIKTKEYQEQYKKENVEKIYQLGVEYRAKNKEVIRERKRLYAAKRRAEDSLYKLRGNIRCLIKNTFLGSGIKKANKTEDILGCTLDFFINYLTAQFTDEMSLDNYGSCKEDGCIRYWELDHIYPVSKAKSEEHLLQLNHYTNFRPLWKEDNRDKYNNIEEVQLRLL